MLSGLLGRLEAESKRHGAEFHSGYGRRPTAYRLVPTPYPLI